MLVMVMTMMAMLMLLPVMLEVVPVLDRCVLLPLVLPLVVLPPVSQVSVQL